jgi:hypothetical protein
MKPVVRALALLLVVAFLLPAVPAVGLPSGTCDPKQAVHRFVAPPVGFNGQFLGASSVFTQDTCSSPIDASVTDGDYDLGVGGGSFPAYGMCLAPGSVAHHAYGVGATYRAANDNGIFLAWTAGADGPDPTAPPCTGNGIISPDASTDPADCAWGYLGVNFGLLGWGVYDATLAPNLAGANPLGDCVPVNGEVAVFLVEGPILSMGGPIIDATRIPPSIAVPALDLVSVPVAGGIWDTGGHYDTAPAS